MKRRKRGVTRLEKKVLEILYFNNAVDFTLVDLVYLFEKAYPNYYKDSHVCYCTLRNLLNQLYRKGLIAIKNEEQYRKYEQSGFYVPRHLPKLILSPKALEYCKEQNFIKFNPNLIIQNKLDTLPDHLRRIA